MSHAPSTAATAPLEIGLALAGAVSAGSYIAGVLDFLFQALEEQERRRGGVPAAANARLSLIAGASGGGIAGSVAAIALTEGVRLPPAGGAASGFVALPRLYDVWVKRPKLFGATAGHDLLSTGDLQQEASVKALLDGTLLETIRDFALSARPSATFRPGYVADDLHVVLTLTNLRGVPYAAEFRSPADAKQQHVMVDHADRQHFVLEGIGSGGPALPDVAGAYKPTKLSTSALPAPLPLANEWAEFGAAVLGTGAFPVGLPARLIEKPFPDDRYQNELRPSLPAPHTLAPDWLAASITPPPSHPYKFWACDGGAMDNEPFGIVDCTLRAAGGPFATILVDPFVEPPDLSIVDVERGGLAIAVLGQLFGALKDQARLRLTEVFEGRRNAGASNYRFLVNPSRSVAFASGSHLASGGLGGFAGFIDESFRRHDFELGRRNCQNFLRRHFAHPSAASDAPPAAIVPLLGSAEPEIPLPDWPRINVHAIDTLRQRLEGRATALVDALNRTNTTKRYKRLLVAVAWRFLRASLLDMVRDQILLDLVQRDQVVELEKLDHDARRVLTCLLEPNWDFRTVGGIAAETQLGIGAIATAMAELEQRSDRFAAVKGPKDPTKGQSYRVGYRKPIWISSLPLVGDWLAKPQID